MDNIVALIVTYNRKKMLLECIESLLSQKSGAPDIFVVDNASTDGTYEALESYIENGTIGYMELDRNLGEAGGFEHGVRKVVDLGYKYVWLLNDDCVPAPDALEAYKKAHNRLKGHYGFLTGKVLWKDKSICTFNIPRTSIKQQMTDFDKDLQKVEFASFASCFVQSSIIKKVYLPIGEFFVGADDAEYTRRISREYPCYYVRDSVTVHNTSTKNEIGIEAASAQNIKNYDYMYRNNLYIHKREGKKALAHWLVDVNKDIVKIVLDAPDNKMKRISTLAKGTFKGVFYNPTVDRA